MNYAEKKEIVERLKKNERAYCFLSDEERAVLDSINYTDLRTLSMCGTWIDKSPFTKSWSNDTFKIKESYELPIELPEGYRLVTDEEREKYGLLEVLDHCYFDGLKWVGMGYGEFAGPMCDGYSFKHYAVPLDFSFEPKKLEPKFCQYCGKRL